MITPRRRFSSFAMFAAIFAFLLTVPSLVAAPLLAGAPALPQPGMAMPAMSADSHDPCESQADKANHSDDSHARSCIVQCLSAHGAVLPELPRLDASRFSPVARPEALASCDLHSLATGIDPPPPREA